MVTDFRNITLSKYRVICIISYIKESHYSFSEVKSHLNTDEKNRSTLGRKFHYVKMFITINITA